MQTIPVGLGLDVGHGDLVELLLAVGALAVDEHHQKHAHDARAARIHTYRRTHKSPHTSGNFTSKEDTWKKVRTQSAIISIFPTSTVHMCMDKRVLGVI